MKRLTLLVLLALALACVAETQPPLIPMEVLLGNPSRFSPRLSPDGGRMTYIAPHEGVLNIWIKTVGGEDDQPLTIDDDQGIFRHWWAKSGEYVLYLQDVDGDENYNIYAVTVETGEVRNLTPYEGVRCYLYDPDYTYPDEILVGMNDRDPRVFDTYRIDLRTGEKELVIENPGDIYGFIFDDDWLPRGMSVPTAEGGSELWVRDDLEDDWRLIMSWGIEEGHSGPLGFTGDGRGIYILDSTGFNTRRLGIYHLADDSVEFLAEDPSYDIGGYYEFSPVTRELDLVTVLADRARWIPLSADVVDDVEFLSERFAEGEFLISDRSRDDTVWLLSIFYVDRSPEVFVYERAGKTLTKLFDIRPELNEYTLAPMESIAYTARDGLRIEGYLTLPPGLEPPYPMVLNVHGGPWVRDTWGFNSEVQFLANRGYAVLQVNYRGSSGYGKEHLSAGFKEWGGAMQDDLTDAVNWAVLEGYADPDRVAIYGWSYGGYAALAGAVFTRTDERVQHYALEDDGYAFYRCAVSNIGPANLITFIETVPPYWTVGQESFYLRVGNPETEREFLESRSPINFVERIEIPMLLLYGATDPRIKITEGEQITAALTDAGIEHEYHVYPDEGHGFRRPHNRLDAFRRIELFLAEHLGGRAE